MLMLDETKIEQISETNSPYYEFKPILKKKKGTYQKVNAENLSETILGLDKAKLESGEINIYLEPKIRNSSGTPNAYWPILDVESDTHNDIQANIDCGKELLMQCIEKGIAPGLTILLTGRGLRFCWQHLIPKSYEADFLYFINDKNLPIDNTFKGKKFTRVLGYRGHFLQDPATNPKELFDVHIHSLDSPSDLFNLTVEKYRQLTNGKVLAEKYFKWWEQIKPDASIALPEAWVSLLNEYRMDRKLKGSIFIPNYSIPKSKGQNNNESVWEQINTYLKSINLTITQQTTNKNVVYFKLTCPICNRPTAYITESGTLKCFHIGGSCAAGKPGNSKEYGKNYIIGLRPHEWVPDFKSSDHIHIETEEKIERKTIEEARNAIDRAIQEEHDILIGAYPGVGKTHSIIHLLIPTCKDRKILYAAPTNDLTGQVYEDAVKIGKKHGVPVYLLEGRNENNCQKFNRTKNVGDLGFSPGVLVCTPCPYKHKGCKYQAQSKLLDNKAGFFIATQQKIKSREIEADDLDCVIYDENPTRVFIESIPISLTVFSKIKAYNVGLRPESKSCIQKIQDAIDLGLGLFQKFGKKRGHNRLYFTKPPKGSSWEEIPDIWEQGNISELEKNSFIRDLSCFQKLESETDYEWQTRLYNTRINLKELNFLLTGFGEKEGGAYVSLDKTSTNLTFEYFNVQKNVPNFSGRTIVLDGTGYKAEMDSLFQRDFKFIDGNVPLPESTKLIFIKRGLGKYKCIDLSKQDIRSILKRAFEQLKPGDKKILLCTHKFLEKKVMKIAKSLLPDKTILGSVHYWGNRGKNHFKDYDAAVAFGTTNVNQTGALDAGQVLFQKKEERENWFRIQGLSEVFQTVFRVRPLQGNKTIIICGREWPPKLGQPNYIINLAHGQTEIEGNFDMAYARIREFVLKNGFITKEVCLGLRIGHTNEKELIEKIQSVIADYTNAYLYHINSILDISRDKAQKNSVLIIGNTSYWSQLLSRLKLEFPNLPKFQVSVEGISNGAWANGLGFKGSVEYFYRRIAKDWPHIKFKEEKWRFDEEKQRYGEKIEKRTKPKTMPKTDSIRLRSRSSNKSVSLKAFRSKNRNKNRVVFTVSGAKNEMSLAQDWQNWDPPGLNDFGFLLRFHCSDDSILHSSFVLQIE